MTADASPDVPRHLVYDDSTLLDQWEASVGAHGSAVATDFFGAERTYADLDAEVDRVAGALSGLGVGPGDAVALLMPSCPQHIVAFEAVQRLGAVAVEHNPLYTAAELRGPFADHGARVAIVWDKAAGVVTGLRGDTPLEHVVAVDLTEALPRLQGLALRLPIPALRRRRAALSAPAPGTIPWRDLRRGPALPAAAPRPAADDVAMLFYTSGTSGAPKGVPLTHRNLVALVRQGLAWVRPPLEPGQETVLVALPMFHAYGASVSVLVSIAAAARLVLIPRPDTELLLAAVKRRTPTFFPAVPPLYGRLLEAAKEQGVSLRGIRSSLSGAMALPPRLVAAWEAETGGLLVEGYGLTETSPVVVGNPFSPRRKPGSIGVPFPDVEVRVVDPENPSVDVEPGSPGELLVRGPQVFGGYRNLPEETEKAFVDGWFRTGDMVTQDADGFLTIVDRLKEVVVTGGFNVFPSEVEAALRDHADVENAAVVGVRDDDGAEEVVAALVMKTGAHLDHDGLREHCRRVLARYKVPRRFVQVDALPTDQMGKTRRREVLDLITRGE